MASGFLAAVACGLTTGLARHASSSKPPSADASSHQQHDEQESIEINTRGGFHPTVALALAMRGRLRLRRMVLYVIAQLSGACLAGLLVEATVGRQCHSEVIEMVMDHVMDYSGGGALGLQAFLNLLLALIYLWTDRRNHLMAFPIIVGFHYASSFLIGLQILGLPVLNPTRAFGVAATALFLGEAELQLAVWNELSVGWAGAFLGVALAVSVDILLFADCLWGVRTQQSPKSKFIL